MERIQRGARRWAPKAMGLRLDALDALDAWDMEAFWELPWNRGEPEFKVTPGASSSRAPAKGADSETKLRTAPLKTPALQVAATGAAPPLPMLDVKEEEEIEEVSMQLVLASDFKSCKEEDKQKRKRAKAKPTLPRFAFEWFREKMKEKSPQELALPDLVEIWKELGEEERRKFIALAEEDRRRFELEYEEWRQQRLQKGKKEPPLGELLEKRRTALETSLARLDQAKKKRKRKTRAPPPPDFPKQPVKSGYGLFCQERRGSVAESEKDGRTGILQALRQAWKELAENEQQSFQVRAAEDQARFREELETWREEGKEVDQQIWEEAQRLSQKTARSAASAALPKVKLNKAAPLVARPRDEETLFDILTGMQIHAARDRQVRAKERPVPGADADAPDAVEDAPADNVVDDLLGDLLAVEGAGAATAFEAEDPKATALGPQLCLDEQGNIVLNQSSLSRNVSQPVPVEESATVQEAVSQYASAYKKTPACKWTEQETDLFYEALSLYGTDLFLAQTFFRNKSAGQIKTKYQKEMRKNPKRVEEALTERAQKLTKDTFEKLHGKIDVSKHYKPPPSPQPGDEPEAHEPEIDEDMAELGGMPPPEPEYSAEDESLTTNRLMALFD